MMRSLLRCVLSGLLAVTCLLAQDDAAQGKDTREATVGMRARIMQHVIEGSELVPAPVTNESPIMLRVLATWPHGEHLRYDLEWMGYEEGKFDLSKYLVRKDGSSMDGVKPIEVEVLSVLPVDAFEPSELAGKAAERLDGYKATTTLFWWLWGLGLVAILFVGRKWQTKQAPPKPKPTLADRLRPLVQEVASGNAETSQKAELERLLVAFWRSRLDLGSVRAVEAIVAIRNHDEAGALLRQVEAWLHAPEPPKSFDVAGLLEPYREVTAESLQVTESVLAGGGN